MLSDSCYSILSVEKFDEERRTFSGVATTPRMDSQGDIIEPSGIEDRGPVKLLLHHDKQRPVGTVRFLFPATDTGLRFEASIPKVAEPGILQQRVDEAWHSVKYGLLTAVSVRVNSRRDGVKKLASGGLHWLKSWLTELSLVTIGANSDAVIDTIRSLDVGRPAATGSAADPSHTPRVRGTVRAIPAQDSTMTIQEQIKTFENTRAAKLARMNELMELSAAKGETLDAAQSEEYDGLESEVKTIDAHLTRLRRHEEMNKAAAVPAAGASAEEASKSRGGEKVIRVTDRLDPGIRFARYAMCIAAGKNSRMDALEIAKSAYPDEHSIHEAIKAAVVPGSTANAAAPLLQYTDWMGDFVEYLRPGTILGKLGTTINGVSIPRLRRIPFNTRVMTQTAGGSAYWVGQGKPKPLTKGTYGTITNDFHKLATIAVLTEEEVKFVPIAEQKVRDDLRDAIAAEMDTAFIDPINAGTANVKPASVTHGVAATAVSGTDADAVRVDFKNLMSAFISANVSVDSPVLIMSKQIALNLSLMLNALGQREFPDLTMDGGRLFGVPVITSEFLTSLGSPSTGMVVLINASDIYYSDDGPVTVTASGEASLEMLDGSLQQDGIAGTGASLVSLWQNNLLGLKAEKFATWKKRRSSAAQYLSPVAYTPAT